MTPLEATGVSSSILIEKAPLLPEDLNPTILLPGGTTLAYAVRKGSQVALGQEGFATSEDVRVAWELEPDGHGILRWERFDTGPDEYDLQVYRDVSSRDSYGDGELFQIYRCYKVPRDTASGDLSWVMEGKRGHNVGQTVYPYAGVPMRPLQNAHETHLMQLAAEQEEDEFRGDRRTSGGAA